MLSEIIKGYKIVNQLTNILSKMHNNGPINVSDLEKLAYIKKYHNDVFMKYETKLLYIMGLFYKVKQPNSILEEVYSLFADSIEEETGNRFTPVQADAYKHIYEKKFFSFSAPTSAGKSFLFRLLINKTFGDIVIVVPSRALIAEYMHAVLQLVDKTVLVLQFVDNINTGKTFRRIFIITPERGMELFSHINEFNIELFLLDEAQISEEKVRGMKFDSFVRRIDRAAPQAKKVFAHPFINNPGAQLKKHRFDNDSVAIRYDQNSVGKIFLSFNNNVFNYFSPYDKPREQLITNDIAEEILENYGTLLIYISKRKIYDGSYINEFHKYIELCPRLNDPRATKLIEKLREFIGASANSLEKQSVMINLMERGIVIHHGSMPLKARLIIEEFVKANYARICFATSTLTQGINMPFDAVWIDNFRNMDTLTLKNLVGRAGRSTSAQNVFEYGYVIVRSQNVNTFCKRLNQVYNLTETSLLDEEVELLPDDLVDIVDAIKYNNFNDEFKLPEIQLSRLNTNEIHEDIQYILDNLLVSGKPLTASEYYKLSDIKRKRLKQSFKNIYIKHLRREDLTLAETSILSTSIPIMLWHIQGKSFREIVSLRYAFLSEKDKQREVFSKFKQKRISSEQVKEELAKIKVRYTPIATTLPNIDASKASLFKMGTPISKIDYDVLVYDTYDYLDKVISLSLADPLCAAFKLYHDKHNDGRALIMSNYIRYGTNNEIEIWLLRYGFAFEDIDWVIVHVNDIDEVGISFKNTIYSLSEEKFKVIERYI
ncbi:DEAD/DEAH box helicase [Desulforamulus aquiferis]|uniref:DEAD/DEAH box helicase n=1 Tax=Desulforamulus aquiferis TaxID=1397668 RepID=A0AAW7ZBB3_9FIRM|nr:DEAD/DEAH box helicase [Desulforamulus aquiferis]MDO7786998.1 DEAD/DEAH box helicase [Desulforamulus aquiferis]